MMREELLKVTRRKLLQLKNTYNNSKIIILGDLQDTMTPLDAYGNYQKKWESNKNSILTIPIKEENMTSIAREETVKRGNTYSTQRGNVVHEAGQRSGRGINHIFISDNVERAYKHSAGVDWDIFSEWVASDHAAVWTDIK